MPGTDKSVALFIKLMLASSDGLHAYGYTNERQGCELHMLATGFNSFSMDKLAHHISLVTW